MFLEEVIMYLLLTGHMVEVTEEALLEQAVMAMVQQEEEVQEGI
jgi:hypothetical protein